MTKTRKKLTIAFLIVCLILSGLLLFIALYVVSTTVVNEKNTVEHTATVSRVETSGNFCTIYVLQYPCGLIITLDEIVCDNYLSELQPDGYITFRVPDDYENWLTEGGIQYLYIVSLQTENADIVTLESHNASTAESRKRGRITGCGFAVMFFAGATVCATLLIINKPKNKATAN